MNVGSAPAIEWARSLTAIDYPDAVRAMQERAARIAAGSAAELVWLLEHPPIYTAGTSARDDELLAHDRFPVHRTGRGGRLTYHGPGQRIAYVMLDVKRRGGDVRAFVAALEGWIIATLAELGVTGETRADRVGVWVRRPEKGARRRGQDRGRRFAADQVGEPSRREPQRASRPVALQRHRTVRHRRPWGDEPCRPRRRAFHGSCG